MQEFASFLAGIAAVLVPVAALVGEARRRHRNAITETIALAETFRSRDPSLAARFNARADQLAREYLDEAEEQPQTYPRPVTAAAIAIGVAAAAAIAAGSSEAAATMDKASPTVAAAGGLVAGLIALGVRPFIGDVWKRAAGLLTKLRRRANRRTRQTRRN